MGRGGAGSSVGRNHAQSGSAGADGSDRIEIDGRPAVAKGKIYLILNKERGVVTTAADERGRATVYDSLPEQSSDPMHSGSRLSADSINRAKVFC